MRQGEWLGRPTCDICKKDCKESVLGHGQLCAGFVIPYMVCPEDSIRSIKELKFWVRLEC